MGARSPRTPRSKVELRRGDVYLVRFDPTEGSEIKKTRPAVVIQNDTGNRFSSTTIVSAISSKVEEPLYPFEVLVEAPEGGIAADSLVLLNQVRTVDRRRLLKRLGSLRPETMAAVDRALQISLASSLRSDPILRSSLVARSAPQFNAGSGRSRAAASR